jgi:hypothetical protein
MCGLPLQGIEGCVEVTEVRYLELGLGFDFAQSNSCISITIFISFCFEPISVVN